MNSRSGNRYTLLIRPLLVLATLLTTLPAYSTYHQYKNFTEEDGFVQNEIYSIGQDKEGFIYIATDMGLYRYDGIRFKLLKSDPRVDNNLIMGIIRLNDEINVCQTLRGKIYYIHNGEVISWLNNDLLGEVDVKGVSRGQKIDSETVLVSGPYIPYFYFLYFDKKGVRDVKKINLPEGYVVVQADAGKDGCWLLTDHYGTQYILYYDYKESRYYEIPAPFEEITRIATIGKQTVLLDSEVKTGFYTYHDHKLEFSRSHSGWNINNLLTNNQGDLWICSSDGLRRMVNDSIAETLFSGMVVNTVFLDRDSNLWVGTVGSGVFLLTPREGRMVHQLQENYMLCVAKNKNTKVFGGRYQIGLIDPESGIRLHELNEEIKKGRGFVKDIAFIDSDHLALACDHGIYLAEIKNHSSLDHKQLYAHCAGKAVVWHDDKLWYGTNEQVGFWERDSGKHQVIKKTRVYAMEKVGNDMIWCATESGLFKVNCNPPHEVQNILQDPCPINDLLYKEGKMFVATSCGSYFIPTSGKPVKKWVLEGVNCLKLDADKEKLVFATPFGLYCYSSSKDRYTFLRTYSKEQGLVSNIINDVQIDGDSLWAVTPKGISVIPWFTSSSPIPRNVNILSVSNLGNELCSNAPVRLTPNSRELSIEFASAVFGNTPVYQYRFLPNNSQWVSTEDNKLVFSKLDPGEYVFEVRNLVTESGKTGPVKSLKISVMPRFYETTFFKLFGSVFVVFMTIAFTFFRANRVNQRKYEKSKREQRLNQLELEAIKAQMNPHFIHNCLNSIHFSILKKQEDAAQQVSSFSRLIRTTMDFSRLDLISVEEEVQYLEQYLLMEKLRFKESLQYNFTYSGINVSSDRIPTMMIQPFIENSIKHGIVPGRSLLIEIRFEKVRGTLICTVEDNGKGFAPKRRKARKELHGISLSRSRAEMYNKIYGYDITIEVVDNQQYNSQKTGTKVVITIPPKKGAKSI